MLSLGSHTESRVNGSFDFAAGDKPWYATEAKLR